MQHCQFIRQDTIIPATILDGSSARAHYLLKCVTEPWWQKLLQDCIHSINVNNF